MRVSGGFLLNSSTVSLWATSEEGEGRQHKPPKGGRTVPPSGVFCGTPARPKGLADPHPAGGAPQGWLRPPGLRPARGRAPPRGACRPPTPLGCAPCTPSRAGSRYLLASEGGTGRGLAVRSRIHSDSDMAVGKRSASARREARCGQVGAEEWGCGQRAALSKPAAPATCPPRAGLSSSLNRHSRGAPGFQPRRVVQAKLGRIYQTNARRGVV